MDDLDAKIALHNTTIEEQERTIRQQDNKIAGLRQTLEAFRLQNIKLGKQLKRKHTAKISKEMNFASIGYILCCNIQSVKEKIESMSLNILSIKGYTETDSSFHRKIQDIEMAEHHLGSFFLKWHENESLDVQLAVWAAKLLRDNLDIASYKLKQWEGKLNGEQANIELVETLKLIEQTRNTAEQFDEMISLGESDYPLFSESAN